MRKRREHLAGAARPSRHLQAAHGHGRLRGVAGEEVGDRHPVVGEQATPGAGAGLDDGGVVGTVGHQDAPQVAVVPAERRDPVGAALEDGLLAGRRRAGQLHGPLVDRVRAGVEPAAQRRHRPGLQHPLHDGEGDTVELDEHDAVDIGVGDLARLDPQQARGEGLVGAGADQPHEQGRERCGEPGRRDRGAERVERRAGDDVHRDLHHDRLAEQGRRRYGEPADGGGHLDEHGTHDHADETGDRGRGGQRQPRRVRETGEQLGRQQQGQERQSPGQQQAEHVEEADAVSLGRGEVRRRVDGRGGSVRFAHAATPVLAERWRSRTCRRHGGHVPATGLRGGAAAPSASPWKISSPRASRGHREP